MRGAPQPARRGLAFAALAETLMRLRALVARRLAPPAPQRLALPPPPRPAVLDRRATPSWMTDPVPRETPAWSPDLVRAAPAPAPEPPWVPDPAPAAAPAWVPEPPVAAAPPPPPIAAPIPAAPIPAPPVAAAPVRAAPIAPAPRPAEPPRPAGPGPDMEDAWVAIPPAGPARTVLTRARRQAETARSLEAASRPAPAPPPAPRDDVPDLRFTRTPDHVLQARRRKREEEARAREAERLAAEQDAAAARAEAEAAAEAARLAAEEAALPPLPRWRQPYVLPPGVKFTRTPDHLLRHAPEEAPPPAPPAQPPVDAEPPAHPEPVAEPAAAEPPSEARPGDAVAVSTDAEALAEGAAVPAQAYPAPADEPAQKPEIVPAAEFDAAEVENGAPIVLPLDISFLRALPKHPPYAFAGMLRHDWSQPLTLAEVQDNRPVPSDADAQTPPVAAGAAPEAMVAPAVEAEPVAESAAVAIAPADAPMAEADSPSETAPDLTAPCVAEAAILAAEETAAPVAVPSEETVVPTADSVAEMPDPAGATGVAAEPVSAPAETAAPAETVVVEAAAPVLPVRAEILPPVAIAPAALPAPAAFPGDVALAPLALTMVPGGPVEPITVGSIVLQVAAPVISIVAPEFSRLPAAIPAAAPASVPAAPEPHGVVIGNAGLDSDLGLDAEDPEDEDDILALVPLPPPPLRPAVQAPEFPYEFPPLDLLTEARASDGSSLDADVLQANAVQLQQVIHDFGVRGEILAVRPGPVVTLYEMEPAPGTKSSRVISLADDIARSMSAISARVAVVQGRNAIGIELPNVKRETVYLREILSSPAFAETKQKLALCLGKNIGGEAIIADLARMPHLLVAGTTGSGKSVAINTMILSLLYRMKPEECRLIMVDPKMLELSVYDGIPHLLSPVVTDPKKAVIALKWAVREMEERYKKMARLGVRNIDGFNARVAEARERGEVITRTVQTGFDRETGEAVYEDEVMDLSALPYIVVIVDEMADLMMVAGKDIEGAIQRLAQMARAAGIHLIMATQRPSVDVITGTIKANFPTRISFQVTSKIDSRTILGEMGAEQLLGQGDMLFMAGGGRTTRVHGPFVSDDEVEAIVAHLKRQGRPAYLDAITAEEGEEGGAEA
ncbi:DNA translocase FtsK, partial [Methylobacterium sp. JK268]